MMEGVDAAEVLDGYAEGDDVDVGAGDLVGGELEGGVGAVAYEALHVVERFESQA